MKRSWLVLVAASLLTVAACQQDEGDEPSVEQAVPPRTESAPPAAADTAMATDTMAADTAARDTTP